MGLNERGYEIADDLVHRAADIAAACHDRGGVRVLDCGVTAPGGDAAGLGMARVALGGAGAVSLLEPAADDPVVAAWPDCPWPTIRVTSDHAVAACLAAQYAGWRVSVPGYFAMASGPMRAAIGREDLFDEIGMRERPAVAAGLLEASKLPPADVCRDLAAAAGVAPERLILLVARTASPAGTLQVAARSLETAIHKLHEVGFDLRRIKGGEGTAPLPPVAADDLAAIGRTNDAILYGGSVVLEVTGDDDELAEVGPRAISRASPAFGAAFREVFEAAGRDFYAIDPALFAPARLELVNVETGRRQVFGGVDPAIVSDSFTAGGTALSR
ncbi:MAG: methenyltetrahydromethanopterin cyclohydrolase [Planctomycetota bacterium]